MSNSPSRQATPAILLGIAVASVVLRLVLLGHRVAHWDEARLAVQILHFTRTGTYSYNPLFHGPFIFHADDLAFKLFGVSDFTMRVPMALIGGVLPLAAWLYRDYLSRDELICLALLLSGNPILVHYSRFARSDILVATFMFAALGFLLRAYHTGNTRYVVGSAAMLALGTTTKENFLLYLAAWLSTSLLLSTWGSWRHQDRNGMPALRANLKQVLSGAWARNLSLSVLVFLVIVLEIYLPRNVHQLSLWALILAPERIGEILTAGLLSPAGRAISYWVLGTGHVGHSYLGFLALLLGLLVAGAAATLGLAGWTIARVWNDRWIVRFTTVWAVLSVLGYPYATDLMSGWIALHVLLPLTIPAAIGLAGLTRTVMERDSRRANVAFAAVYCYLGIAVLLTSFVAPGAMYNPIAQPSQMSTQARPAMHTIASQPADSGIDVGYVGSYWANWNHRLPLPWYVAQANASSIQVNSVAGLSGKQPSVLVTTPSKQSDVESAFPQYTCHTYTRIPWVNFHPTSHHQQAVICSRTGAKNSVKP